MGGMSSPLRDHWVHQLWKRAEKAGYWILVAHIGGVDNFQADFASQVFNHRTEWALPQYIVDKLVHHFGCPTVDHFVTQLNKNLKRYVSWFPDPTSAEVDAFSIQWTHEFPYLFPPFNLIYRCLEIVQQQKVEKNADNIPILAKSTLVSSTTHHAHQPHSNVTKGTSSLSTMAATQQQDIAPTTQQNDSQHCTYLRSSLYAMGVSSANVSHVKRAIRPQTSTNYMHMHNKWFEFCKQKKRNPYHPTLKDIFEFLHHRSKLPGVTAATLRSYRFKLKHIVDPDCHHVLDHVYVSRYITGFFNDKPHPIRPWKYIWDINIVLIMFQRWPSNAELSLPDLTRKMIMLFLLSTCRRKCELMSLHLDHIRYETSSIVFELTSLPKTYSLTSQINELHLFCIEEFPDDEKLCPLQAL